MKYGDLVDYIKQELQSYELGRYIEKYGVEPTSIINMFEFNYDGESDAPIKQVSPFIIYNNPEKLSPLVYDEMIRVGMLTIPSTLVERLGQSVQTELRRIDDAYFIRMPSYPSDLDADIDIDEVLSKVVGYRVLSTLGISRFNQVAKELISAHADMATVPSGDCVNAVNGGIDVRFSVDGTAWHENFLAEDKFISYKRNEIWGASIPLAGSNTSSTGASNFADLQDVGTLEAGKMLVVNAEGNAIECQDIPEAQASTGGGGAIEDYTVSDLTTANNIVDISGANRLHYFNCEENVEISFSMDGYDYNVADGSRHTFVIQPNGNTVTFNPQMFVQGLNTIDTMANNVIITLLYIQYNFYCLEQKEF